MKHLPPFRHATIRVGAFKLVLALLLSACSRSPLRSYKLILVLDSTAAQYGALASSIKAAKLGIEKFNGVTNINGLPLELEVLDLGQTDHGIISSAALQHYTSQLQRGSLDDAEGKQRSLILGFVLWQEGQSVLQDQFRELLSSERTGLFVLLGNWPTADSGHREQNQPAEPIDQGAHLLLNLAPRTFAGNQPLVRYIREVRGLNWLYLVYDESERERALDFSDRIRRAGIEPGALVSLEYNSPEVAKADYSAGYIQSMADLFRDQRIPLQRAPDSRRAGLLMFLKQSNARKAHLYLARSPYSYLFDELDFILYSEDLILSELPDPEIERYFVFTPLRGKTQQRNYQIFEQQYQNTYHLRASQQAARLYDAVCLLANTAKQTIESNNFDSHNLANELYQNLLQSRFDGSTGQVIFDHRGQRLRTYTAARLRNGEFEPAGHFAADSGNFVSVKPTGP